VPVGDDVAKVKAEVSVRLTTDGALVLFHTGQMSSKAAELRRW